MTESRYLQVFGDATDALLNYIGMDQAYRSGGFSVYTVETHIRHLLEIAGGEPLTVETQLLGFDEKRLRKPTWKKYQKITPIGSQNGAKMEPKWHRICSGGPR